MEIPKIKNKIRENNLFKRVYRNRKIRGRNQETRREVHRN